MSTNSTASTYIVKINQDYPVAGQDNNSQGFRDNFKNIKLALNSTDEVLNDLVLSAVSVSNTSTNFNNNIIEKVVLKNTSFKVFDKSSTLTYGNETIDYSLGHYQKYKLSSGAHIFTVVNWPSSNNQGFLTLEVTAESGASINFSAIGSGTLFNLGPDSFPLVLTQNQTYVFELWNGGNTNNLYVKSELNASSSSGNSIRIGSNLYTTGTNFETIVSNGEKFGTLGIIQNVVSTTITNIETDFPGDSVATKFGIATSAGIGTGAKVSLPGSTQTHIVSNIANNIVTVSPAFPVGGFIGGETVKFLNPRFNNQETLLSLKSEPVTSATGSPGDYKGQVYVNETSLWVAYDDYNGTKNWFSVVSSGGASLGVGNAIANNSTQTAATTAFVHSILPYGTIIMWYGSVATIPSGWALCNGANNTPNLVDRFVIGSGSTYAVGSTGGTTTTDSAGSHTHTGTIDSAGVPSTGWTLSGGAPGTLTAGALVAGSGAGEIGETLESIRATSSGGSHNHTMTNSTEGAHTHSLIPPYYALCYIMKTTGGA